MNFFHLVALIVVVTTVVIGSATSDRHVPHNRLQIKAVAEGAEVVVGNAVGHGDVACERR